MNIAFIVLIVLFSSIFFVSQSTIECVINSDVAIVDCYKSSIDTLGITLNNLYENYWSCIQCGDHQVKSSHLSERV
ncbi:Uncharacterised protein [Yersinia pekkanenii]|uniref:Uncharacterized protein n=1 Tax=Yersinia pekkanenii TaxID=1288385 RepID=A0ABM9TNC6_9GAMM|nr:Uncharacterised protein [Yersinia pekkanenii]